MKGVLICGGTGSRLRPLTLVTNKSLLPVYDQPLIHYPLQVLLDAGIKEIAVITGPEHMDQMVNYLGSGSRFGCEFTYKEQEKPEGLAQALGMAEDFADGENICALLGDNIYFDNVSEVIRNFQSGGHVFLKEVQNASRFGVAELGENGKVVSFEEKPLEPKSSYAATGLYIYDARCFDVIKNLNPSARGEYEITDIHNWYVERGELSATLLQDEWVDAGTFESLYQAAETVRERKMDTIETAKNQTTKETTPITN